jgi:hypothetical protein
MTLRREDEPRRILRNRPSLSDLLAGRAQYVDAALWSPDGEFLLLKRRASPNWLDELEQPHVLHLASGKVEALPFGSMGGVNSWGGKP